MRQVLQAAKGGATRVADVPEPVLRPGGVLVDTAWSLISPGTERMVIELAGKSLLGKARARPDLVKKTLEKVRREGLLSTYRAVTGRLAGDVPLGYSAAGVVVEAADGVSLKVGDRVACAGAGHANHAERNFVPENLCARIPDGVDLRHAATATLGAIALHGVRTAGVALGETAVVVGLGLLGQLAVQMLRAAGARVVGVDLDPWRAGLAKAAGADAVVCGDEDPCPVVAGLTGGHGADAVLVCAASKGNEPLTLAGDLCRKGGVVAVVGAVGMELDRRLFYAKEIQVRMCTSYGPGRYDPVYEERGIDYPYPYVRWTEGRNLSAVLDLMAAGRLDVEPLITHGFPIERAQEAYELVTGQSAGSFLGIVLEYPGRTPAVPAVPEAAAASAVSGGVRLGVVGAGQFATAVLLPALKANGDVVLEAVASAGGSTADAVKRHLGFARVAVSGEELIRSGGVDAVMVVTRHDSHADLVAAALAAGLPCFVEKPLSIDQEGLDRVIAAMHARPGLVCVGFNRRFAPGVTALRARLAARTSPLHARYRVNAGKLPPDHWTLDRAVGGGRIVGECCHFVDLLRAVVGAPVVRVQAEAVARDGAAILLRFADGSTAVLDYGTTGDASLPKELLEVHWEGESLELRDFRALTLRSRGRTRELWKGSQDKGHRAELDAFVAAVVAGGVSPVPFDEAVEATRVTFAALRSIATGGAVDLGA